MSVKDDAPALLAELKAAVGYMRNAKIDLETGCTKATAIRTISGGIDRAEKAIAAFDHVLAGEA